ncbi:Spy/CpxP family protein refolding chaperone [Ideonella azotifigens]|uniref:Periplasmic heavy metal sensor n=1 Tax=Ideonella azotifigens TaxID=513160 RepID=A0ABN1JYZ7_9BURK|nr:Spy/CpxP family protein refolding chaperone [Ideonella azotifigens]MCD2342790.1 Spy/CpxP family protein refolding chaperone [Ideonella azotifigens]
MKNTTSRQVRLVGLGLLLSLIGGLGLVAMASAHEAPGQMQPAQQQERPHPGAGSMPRGGFMPAMMMVGRGGGLPPEGPPLDHLLDELKATPEQRAELRKIVGAMRDDVKALHEAGRGEHEQLGKLFTQPTVDPAAVEALRQRAMSREDSISRRVTQGMLAASKVLTPEQRQQMGERLAHMGHDGEPHGRPGPGPDGRPDAGPDARPGTPRS